VTMSLQGSPYELHHIDKQDGENYSTLRRKFIKLKMDDDKSMSEHEKEIH